MVEGAVIHCIKTFKNNKSFNEEDNILSHFVIYFVKKSKGAADTLGDPLLSIAGTQGESNQRNPRVGAEELPLDRSHLGLQDGQRDAPLQGEDVLPRRSERIRNRTLRGNTPGD